jgi:hypothetical protein
MAAPVMLVESEVEYDPISVEDLKLGLGEFERALPRYKKARAFYDGNVDEFIANSRLRRKLRATARAYRINFANTPVDSLAERLRIASITVQPEDADAVFQAHWTAGRMLLRSRKTMLEASKMGDAYLITWPETDDNGVIVDVHTWLNSPENCRIIYDEDRPLVKKFAIKRWAVRGDRVRVDLYYRDRLEKLITKKGAKGTDAAEFERYFEDEDDREAWPEVNPFDKIPVFHFRNDEDYGNPEHEKFYGVQMVLFKLIVAHMTGVDYQALPQRWKIANARTGLSDASAVDADTFAVDGTSDEDDEDESHLTSEPGALWDLKDTQSVGQFDSANHLVFTDPMITYLRMGAQITSTPVHKIDPTGQVESGESRDTAEAPFTNKCLDRQDWHEATWREWVEWVCELLGSPAASVDVRWEPVTTKNDKDSWAVAAAKLDAGVPIQVVMVEMNYEPDEVETWFADFDPDSEHDAKVLKAIGDALIVIGTAQTLGVVSPEQVQAIIAAVIGDEEGDDGED